MKPTSYNYTFAREFLWLLISNWNKVKCHFLAKQFIQIEIPFNINYFVGQLKVGTEKITVPHGWIKFFSIQTGAC